MLIFETPDSKRMRGCIYDASTKQLVVVFGNGDVYEYEGVSKDHVDGLRTASSPGTYLSRVLEPDVGPGSAVMLSRRPGGSAGSIW